MITLDEARALAKECEEKLKGGVFASITSVGELRWLLEVNQPEERVSLFICLHKPFSRFHLSSLHYQKGTSPWTASIQKHLRGATVESCSLLGSDRILQLVFATGETLHYLLFELFTAHAYLLDASRNILSSTPKRKEGVYTPPPATYVAPVLEVVCNSVDIERLYAGREASCELTQRKELLERAIRKKLKGAEVHVERARAVLCEAKSWEEKEHLAQLLKGNFGQIKRGMKEIELPDWEKEGKSVVIELDPSLLPQDQIDRFFKRARKLKKGVPHTEILLAKREDELKELQQAARHLQTLNHLEELEAFAATYHLLPPPPPKRERSEPKKRLPYRTFTTEQGMTILSGKSDKDGDALTFTIANGSDYWFHVANYPGSHVVLKCPKGKDPDPESVYDAALIALHFSKAKKAGADEITVTQVKHVVKPRGAKPGLVTVSRHKKMPCRLDQKRLDRLFATQSQTKNFL